MRVRHVAGLSGWLRACVIVRLSRVTCTSRSRVSFSVADSVVELHGRQQQQPWHVTSPPPLPTRPPPVRPTIMSRVDTLSCLMLFWRYSRHCDDPRRNMSSVTSVTASRCPRVWNTITDDLNISDLKRSSTEGPISINNHSVTLTAPAIRLIGRHTACF